MRVNTQYLLERLNKFVDGDPNISKETASLFLYNLELELDRLRNLADELVKDKSRKIVNEDGWRIDYSTGTPILMYDDCSVIESEQALFVMEAIKGKTNES